MRPKLFLRSWFLSAVLMFGLSYLWHGVLLNDYARLKVPISVYLGLAGLVYAVIAAILVYLYWYTHTRNLKYKGLYMGALMGFFIYLIAFVLGVSFNQSSTEHIVVDFVWQMIEQGIGGSLIGLMIKVSTDADEFSKA